MRVIAIERQATCSALEVYPDLPAEMATTNWTTLANAEHSVYLPLSNTAHRQPVRDRTAPLPTIWRVWSFHYNPGIAARPLQAPVRPERAGPLATTARGVRAYWPLSVEHELIATYPDVLAETLPPICTTEDPAAAADSVAAYTIDQSGARPSSRLRHLMYDELMWYVISNTNTMKYTTGEDEHYVPSMLEVEADAEADDAAA